MKKVALQGSFLCESFHSNISLMLGKAQHADRTNRLQKIGRNRFVVEPLKAGAIFIPALWHLPFFNVGQIHQSMRARPNFNLTHYAVFNGKDRFPDFHRRGFGNQQFINKRHLSCVCVDANKFSFTGFVLSREFPILRKSPGSNRRVTPKTLPIRLADKRAFSAVISGPK
ncbi:MAG: hypothetical protein H8E27_08880 [Verrucomicrobia subdivision 3 bacterium]|nr:hypothetical protein [Limisphaerales bacterium]